MNATLFTILQKSVPFNTITVASKSQYYIAHIVQPHVCKLDDGLRDDLRHDVNCY